ncbi:lipid kinase YegS [Azotobacter vinelandii]|uniref:lipid kinase YegS n=1 Tax=Azotobacter vinelandii TaxID=354 RepID=UPI000773B0FA|nr:lipid kinase YegS [Azotobacter vinelandii]WKN23401.1 lipid kinase YegS [Azotobacter vinelandii]
MAGHKAWLVLHGRQASNEELRTAILARREAGWEIAVRLTWEAGDARRLVGEGLAAGYPTVIAGGGDGTLREVAEAMVLAGSAASLAILPLGTANDFARAAGIPLTPAEALTLLEVAPSPVDLGEVDGRLFLNMATGGVGSKVTASTPEELKKALGGAAYLLAGLTRLSELHASFGRFHGPGFHWEGEFLALGIGNGRQAGGGNPLCPGALVDDGLLDLCIVPAPEDTESPLGTLGALISQRILGGAETLSIGARLPWIEVEAPEGLDLNLDGEPANSRSLRFTTRAAALRVHLPPDSPLLCSNCGPRAAEPESY